MTGTAEGMLDVLGADGPHPAHAEQLMLYGQFVGAWDGTVTVFKRDGGQRTESCEVYFGWVLEGRAVQDVWIAPARRDRAAVGAGQKDIYGTTIRAYDSGKDAWEIHWIEPNTRSFSRMTGARVGADIVQEYRDEEDGSWWQWRFTEITPGSFRWIARESLDERVTWTLRNEFVLRRRAE